MSGFEQPVLSGDEHAQAKLQAFVGPFILRRLKSDVLKDLPDKIENVITVQLEGEQRRLYAALEQRLRASINKTRDVDFRNDRIQVLSQLTRLRQVCCDPRLVYENAGTARCAVRRQAPYGVALGQARCDPGAGGELRDAGAQGADLLPVHQLSGPDRRTAAVDRHGL